MQGSLACVSDCEERTNERGLSLQETFFHNGAQALLPDIAVALAEIPQLAGIYYLPLPFLPSASLNLTLPGVLGAMTIPLFWSKDSPPYIRACFPFTGSCSLRVDRIGQEVSDCMTHVRNVSILITSGYTNTSLKIVFTLTM